jgi:hypothetical protein
MSVSVANAWLSGFSVLEDLSLMRWLLNTPRDERRVITPNLFCVADDDLLAI